MPIPSGALRFNSDSGKLEYYNGEAWWQIDNFSADNATGGARGLFGSGYIRSPAIANSNVVDYVTISTTGNAIDFGDLTVARRGSYCSFSSSTRGLWATGYSSAEDNTIDYVTISSTGNASDFGDVTVLRYNTSGCSNSTRGIVAGGRNVPGPRHNVIDYVTMASTGDAKDFGDLTLGRDSMGSCSSTTRGVFAGGIFSPNGTPASASPTNTIDFITTSSTGNALDFGDLSVAKAEIASGSCSNSTRGLFAGGYVSPANINVIEYITIASTGNSADFGDLLSTNARFAACASQTRAVFSGGYSSPGTAVNVIQYVTIMSTGNAIDFGDLTTFVGNGNAGCSNAHGGL